MTSRITTDSSLQAELQSVVKTTLEVMLDGGRIVPEQLSALPEEDVAVHEREVGAVVHIIGDWLGSVSLIMPESLLLSIAQSWYGEEGFCVEDIQVVELMKELSNLVGGNLKPVLGETCILSIPKFFRQRDNVIESGLNLPFRYCGESFSVLIEHDRAREHELGDLQKDESTAS